jgi:hypothetical protein
MRSVSQSSWRATSVRSRGPSVEPSSPSRRVTSRGFGRLAALFAVISAGVYGYFLLTDRRPNSYTYFFYDLQSRALLHLRLNVPAGSLGAEGFVVHGRTYEYFGPMPALLRLPIEAFTSRFDGHLGVLSMFLAFGVLMTFTVRLATRLRRLVRGSAPITPGERWAVALFVLFLGAGSEVVFLASHTWVYQEAEMWAVALSVAAFDGIVAFTRRASIGNLAMASGFTTAALLDRGVTGLGPLLALGVVCLIVMVRRGGGLVGLDERPVDLRVRMLGAVAVAIPFALYCAVNYAKFGSLISVPWVDQLSQTVPQGIPLRQRAGSSMLQLGFFPGDLIQYLRPNAIRFTTTWPWWQFENLPKTMALYSPASSLTTTMPAFVALGVIGTAGAALSSRVGCPRLAAVRAPILGACGASLVTLSYGFIAQRYLGDFVPGLIVASLAGLHLSLRWSAGRARGRSTRLAWAALGILAVFGAWTTLTLTDLYASHPFT